MDAGMAHERLFTAWLAGCHHHAAAAAWPPQRKRREGAVFSGVWVYFGFAAFSGGMVSFDPRTSRPQPVRSHIVTTWFNEFIQMRFRTIAALPVHFAESEDRDDRAPDQVRDHDRLHRAQ